MNKQRKRCISAGKFKRVSNKGIRLKPFFDMNDDELVFCNPFYFNGFVYWMQYNGSIKMTRYYRKSIEEALK